MPAYQLTKVLTPNTKPQMRYNRKTILHARAIRAEVNAAADSLTPSERVKKRKASAWAVRSGLHPFSIEWRNYTAKRGCTHAPVTLGEFSRKLAVASLDAPGPRVLPFLDVLTDRRPQSERAADYWQETQAAIAKLAKSTVQR